MTDVQFLITVAVLAFSVALTRFLPFLVFGNGRTPKIVDYLGKVLPAAMMGLLVVYCFKDVDFGSVGSLVPTLVASACVAVVHLLKRNTVLSITAGTAVYMLLIRVI